MALMVRLEPMSNCKRFIDNKRRDQQPEDRDLHSDKHLPISVRPQPHIYYFMDQQIKAHSETNTNDGDDKWNQCWAMCVLIHSVSPKQTAKSLRVPTRA